MAVTSGKFLPLCKVFGHVAQLTEKLGPAIYSAALGDYTQAAVALGLTAIATTDLAQGHSSGKRLKDIQESLEEQSLLQNTQVDLSALDRKDLTSLRKDVAQILSHLEQHPQADAGFTPFVDLLSKAAGTILTTSAEHTGEVLIQAETLNQELLGILEKLEPSFQKQLVEIKQNILSDLGKKIETEGQKTRDHVDKSLEGAVGEIKEAFRTTHREVVQVPDEPKRFAPSRILRHSPKHLFGREPWLDELDDVWANHQETNIYSLIAWGGSGKTSLVAHWVAQRLAAKDWPGVERYFDWSFYSQGAREQSQNSADLFIDKALQFFGDPDPKLGSPWDRGERLAGLVQKHRTLLILDGLEPLQFPPESKQTGELKDQALIALLQTLAFSNSGLCILTSREEVTNLASLHGGTVTEKKLNHLPLPAAISLLQHLDINGTEAEMKEVWQSVGGHALTLSLLGRFLADAHGKDLRKWKEVKFEEADCETQGRTAMKVLTAYEHWLQSGGPEQQRDLAVLRLTGLFDRPADPGCLKALRSEPAIPGLTETIVPLQDYQWRKALTDLESLDLLTLSGEDENNLTLDAHPLVREYFATQLRDHHPEAFRTAHSRLFDHLCESTEHQPDTLADLQPLYQAITHGCLAHRHQEACDKVYTDRILRGTGSGGNYSTFKLGAISSDLAAISSFFDQPWSQLSSQLSEPDQAWLLNEAAFRLRALGRLSEALEPMQTGLEKRIEQKIWTSAARIASNLSELQVTLGYLPNAITSGHQAITYADQSEDWSRQMVNRTTDADALHQYHPLLDDQRQDLFAGALAKEGALALFQEAETFQAKHQPDFPLLYSAQGFQYCDLLLTPTEKAVWSSDIPVAETNLSGDKNVAPPLTTTEDLSAKALAATAEVTRRGLKMIEWRATTDSLLTIALDHLTLARAGLYQALLTNSIRPLPIPDAPDSWPHHLQQALSTLRQANSLHHLPKALLTTAHFHAVTGNPSEAERFLAEAQLISERGPMPLYLADVHLHRARLFKNKSELEKAAHLIEKHHYGRRFDELADAQAASENW